MSLTDHERSAPAMNALRSLHRFQRSLESARRCFERLQETINARYPSGLGYDPIKERLAELRAVLFTTITTPEEPVTMPDDVTRLVLAAREIWFTGCLRGRLEGTQLAARTEFAAALDNFFPRVPDNRIPAPPLFSKEPEA